MPRLARYDWPLPRDEEESEGDSERIERHSQEVERRMAEQKAKAKIEKDAA